MTSPSFPPIQSTPAPDCSSVLFKTSSSSSPFLPPRHRCSLSLAPRSSLYSRPTRLTAFVHLSLYVCTNIRALELGVCTQRGLRTTGLCPRLRQLDVHNCGEIAITSAGHTCTCVHVGSARARGIRVSPIRGGVSHTDAELYRVSPFVSFPLLSQENYFWASYLASGFFPSFSFLRIKSKK